MTAAGPAPVGRPERLRSDRPGPGRRGLSILALACLGAACVLQAEEPDARALFREGVTAFFAAKPKESVAAFDRMIARSPQSAPDLWQRGLALYYAEDYANGRKQFEVHQTVNPRDVENAAWHFICVAKLSGVEAARKALIPIAGDARVPMQQIHALFAGTGTEAEVLKAAANPDVSDEARRNQLCYAHLYLGLYHEALGQTDLAKANLRKAAKDHRMDHYMGHTAQVHVKLRGWDD